MLEVQILLWSKIITYRKWKKKKGVGSHSYMGEIDQNLLGSFLDHFAPFLKKNIKFSFFEKKINLDQQFLLLVYYVNLGFQKSDFFSKIQHWL